MFGRLDLLESLGCRESVEIVLPLAPLEAEDVLPCFEHVNSFLHQFPEEFDYPLSIEKDVAILRLLKLIDRFDVELAQFLYKHVLVDHSASLYGYLSRISRFFKM